MEPNQDRSLIPLPANELAVPQFGGNRIVGQMVDEVLALGRLEVALQAPQFRIGEYCWCEPDYRQLIRWAEGIKITPQCLVEKLLKGMTRQGCGTRFQEGRIISLSWNLVELPNPDFRCVDGLILEEMVIYCSPSETNQHLPHDETTGRKIAIRLPSLRSFICDYCNVYTLTLSYVPNLTVLSCVGNRITELDISRTPNLTKLYCWINAIDTLDISYAPNLTTLHCGENRIAELEFSQSSNLTELWILGSRLTELDLSKSPNLTKVYCTHGHISNLNLGLASSLLELDVSGNKLTRLELSSVPKLRKLACQSNRLKDLDLSQG